MERWEDKGAEPLHDPIKYKASKKPVEAINGVI